jgi:DNA-binding transcriptional LysR family regulator
MQRMFLELLCCLSMHDLRRLRAFYAVADTGSFSAAALELGYAQSVVSHHVAALEREFGLTLVNRATRPVSVTDAGGRLLAHATAVLGHVTAAEEELRAIVGLQSGTLRLGAFLSACHSFVPPALARFESAHPGVDVVLEQLEEPEAVQRLRSGQLDLAVIWHEWQAQDGAETRQDEGLEQVHLADDHYRVVLPPGHRLSRLREIRISDLAGERFNAPPAEGFTLPYRAMLERLCRDAGFEPDIAYVLREVAVARAFVAAGLCVSLMAELALLTPHANIVVKPIRDVDPFRSIYATWTRGRRVPSAPAMVECLADAAATMRR